MAEDGFAMGYALGQDSNGGNNGGGMFGGGDGWWGIILLALLFGWGGGGRGFGNGGGGGGNGFTGFGGFVAPWATQADVRAAVDQQTLVSKLDEQSYGIADATYSLNNSITTGFHGVDNAICNLGYNVQSGFNSLSHELADCCCKTQRAIDGVNFNMAKGFCDLGNVINMQTRDIIDNQNANYRGLMDFLVTEKLANKDARIAELSMQVSQSNQNAVIGARIDAAVAEVLRRTGNDCPTAAYLVQPPTPVNFPTNGCGTVQFGNYGNNGGCGCGY